MKVLAVVFTVLALTGCQTIQSNSRVNPQVAEVNYKLNRIAVAVYSGMLNLDKKVIRRLEAHGLEVYDYVELQAFYGEEGTSKIIKDNRVTAFLNISSGSSGQRNSQYTAGGTTTTFKGNTAYTTGNTYTSSNGATRTTFKLFDIKGVTIAYGDINLDAQGLLFTGSSSLANGTADGIVDELEDLGLLPN